MKADRKPGAGAWMPVFLRLADQPVLVVGGGAGARRKVDRVIRHGARVDLIAASLDPPLGEYLRQGLIRRIDALRQCSPGHGLSYRLIIVATGDEALRREALAYARTHNIPVNAVDDPDNCSAILPAIVDRAPITIAIGSGGAAPELARMIRSRIEELLPPTLGPLARLAADLNNPIRRRFPTMPLRRRFLDWLFRGEPAAAIEAARPVRARRMVEQCLEDQYFDPRGSLALVGAGPGDPELLTLKALRCIQDADVIMHDALVDARILDYARRDAEIVDVSKRGGKCSTPQFRINKLMREHVLAGKRVVRLKGGDPMVFGRGGEELEYLRSQGIAYSVVPGITAASGCAAYAGIPLTHRDHAQSVRLVTAHGKGSVDRLDWYSLAREHQTLGFYMAVARLEDVQANLIRHGRRSSTPVAVVENGARPEQRVLTGTLDQLHDLGRIHSIRSPAMVYVGGVAALADRLGWYGQAPLTLTDRVPAHAIPA